MSTVEEQIAARSRKHRGEALTNLHQFIDEGYLLESFYKLNNASSAGVDGENWQAYENNLSERIPSLLSRFKGRTYKAPNIRRVYIPKGDGGQRPLGIPTVEDKLLQTAVSGILNPIYEQEFYPCSWGFRKGYRIHDAIRKLNKEVSYRGKRYIIDADIEDFFGSIDHQHLRSFLDERIKDGVLRRMIDKWLKAGILESGQTRYPTQGTPQGGTISPLLSNIYLHHVLDKWFNEEIRPLLTGSSFELRYADDFILGFSNKRDAERVMKVLPKRFAKYGLRLHPEKTRIVELGGNKREERDTFDFLGFTHYMGKSRKGRMILKHKTMSKRKRRALQSIHEWIKANRHCHITHLIVKLNQKLRGHYGYYGITYNWRSLREVYYHVRIMLKKWLNRRGGKRRMNWDHFSKIVDSWCPLAQPRIVYSYSRAKP